MPRTPFTFTASVGGSPTRPVVAALVDGSGLTTNQFLTDFSSAILATFNVTELAFPQVRVAILRTHFSWRNIKNEGVELGVSVPQSFPLDNAFCAIAELTRDRPSDKFLVCPAGQTLCLSWSPQPNTTYSIGGYIDWRYH